MNVKIFDFNNVATSSRKYGGMAGLKLGVIIENENWLLKFPKSTKGFNKVEISYTTTPLSEYIGSQIYDSIGIETHQTRLGIKDGKIVVACKDFLKQGEKLYEFREIKNDYVEGLEEELDSLSSSGNGTELSEIITIMNKNDTFINLPGLRERFWDMFVIDAIIGNNDRNNGNWGIIVNEADNNIRIAPVYDNGASFSSTVGDSRIKQIMSDEDRFYRSAYESRTSAFYENERNINPLKYIEMSKNEELNSAILRIMPKIDLNKIKDIIYSIPNEYQEIKITSDIQKEYYYEVVKYRINKVLIPTYEKI